MDHPILGHVALAYSPVIDRNRSVIATRLSVFPLNPNARHDPQALLDALAQAWPVGGAQLWMNVTHEQLLHDLLVAQPGSHIHIEVPAFMACQDDNIDPICTLHANGNTLLLKGRPLQELPRAVLPCFKYALVDLDDDRRVDQTTGGSGTGSDGLVRHIAHVQAGITTTEQMEASFRRGATAVLGWPIDDVIKTAQKPADQPALQIIVQLIDQVHRQDDIEDLEATLKRDPPLAYKLMRYINSPAFGLSVEISSFRHAIMILGYQRLKRWLALLLATASKDPNMRPVMFAAVRRGLLMEELARIGGDEDMRNELFICGVFSLLDRMLGQPFTQLLSRLPVPERVALALLDGAGAHAPGLALAQAVEAGLPYDIEAGMELLMLTPGEYNEAVLKSLAAARQLHG